MRISTRFAPGAVIASSALVVFFGRLQADLARPRKITPLRIPLPFSCSSGGANPEPTGNKRDTRESL